MPDRESAAGLNSAARAVPAAVPARSPRILLVTPVSPWDTTFGGGQRSALLLDALAELMPVDVLMVTEGDRNEAAAGDRPGLIARLTWRHPRFAPYKYGIHSWVDRWCRENIDFSRYGLVAGRYLTPMSKAAWPRHACTMVDCDDAYYRYAPVPDTASGRALSRARGWIRFMQTRTAIGRYDHAFFPTRRDLSLFPCRSASVLPNAVRAPPEPPPHPGGSDGTALVVGSMWYAPNRQGVDWLLNKCWPAISARCPSLALRIVGAGAAADRERWSRAQRVEAPGYVDDLDAEYARALFTIAPVHSGGGSCLKFLESAAYRRPCIVTRHVFEAFATDFRDGVSVAVAGDAQGMVEQCVALYGDADRRSDIAGQAHRTVLELYNVRRFKDAVQSAWLALRQNAAR